MVKKYSPTTDGNDTPIMKTDNGGHFIHVDDYNTAVKIVENILYQLENLDPSVLTIKRLGLIEDLRKAVAALK